MLIEKIIFNLLAVSLFIIIFFKMISKNDTGYISFLVLQFVGITIEFLEIIIGTTFITSIKMVTYILSIILPIVIIILEKNNKSLLEYLYILIAKILKIFNISKSKRILIKLLNRYPNSYKGHKMLAEIYRSEGGTRKSIDEYVKAVDINKKDYDSYYKIAEMLSELDKKDESIEMLRTLISKKPEYYKASELLGGLLCEKERFKEAINVYQNVLKYDSNNFEAYYNMGIAYTRLNDFNNAKICYEMAAQINAEEYYIYYSLGILALMFNDIEEAREYFYKSINNEFVEAKGYYNLAKISIINGEKENAINYLNQAIELEPKLSYRAIEEDVFIPIKKFIHIKNTVLEEMEEKNKLPKKEIKAEEHLENTYEIAGTISKNELKKMNSFKEERIELERNSEREK